MNLTIIYLLFIRKQIAQLTYYTSCQNKRDKIIHDFYSSFYAVLMQKCTFNSYIPFLESLNIGSIPRNFKISIFKPKCFFLDENHTIDDLGEFSDFFEFILYMNFAIFLKMAISIMAMFVKDSKNHI